MSSKNRKLAVTRDKCGARLRPVSFSSPSEANLLSLDDDARVWLSKYGGRRRGAAAPRRKL